MKKFYAMRFLSQDEGCTIGNPNAKTGRMSLAVDIQVFRTKSERDKWVADERWSGSMSGKRIAATKKDCRRARLGSSPAEFQAELDSVEMSRYDI